jgi:hypothetical protein
MSRAGQGARRRLRKKATTLQRSVSEEISRLKEGITISAPLRRPFEIFQ